MAAKTGRHRTKASKHTFCRTSIPSSGNAFTRSRGIPEKDLFFLQNHHGVYRSNDGAKTWQEIENGLPSNFGFGLTVSNAGSVFIVPLQSDGQRFTCDGKLRVYRSRDNGDTWKSASRGLPQKNAYEVILRDAVTSTGNNIFLERRTANSLAR